MKENFSLEEAHALALKIRDAADALQSAIDEAHRAGLAVELSIEKIGDCTSARERPELLISINYPLATNYRLYAVASRGQMKTTVSYPLSEPPAPAKDEEGAR